MDEEKLTESDLHAFIGSETLYQHPFSNLKYTEGIQYLAQRAGAYWLIDLIGSYQANIHERTDDYFFQLWTIDVAGNRALVTCKADTHEPSYISQMIEYTDFPFTTKMYVVDGVLMLPTEY